MELPVTDDMMVSSLRMEYEHMSQQGSREAPQACFRHRVQAVLVRHVLERYVWGLVHSQRPAEVRRGLDLAEQLLKGQDLDGQDQRDLIYLIAVAQFKLGNVLDARRQLDELLAVAPHSRQAQSLKEACEQQIVREGLVGIGIGSAVLGLAAVAIGLAFGARR